MTTLDLVDTLKMKGWEFLALFA